MTDKFYTYDLVLLSNTAAQIENLLHRLEQAAGGVFQYLSTDKNELMCFKHGAITNLYGRHVELSDQLTYLKSNISFTETDVIIRLSNTLTAIDGSSIIWKSDICDEKKLKILASLNYVDYYCLHVSFRFYQNILRKF